MLYGDRGGGLTGAALLKKRRGWVGGFHGQVLTHCQSGCLHTQRHADNDELQDNTPTQSMQYSSWTTIRTEGPTFPLTNLTYQYRQAEGYLSVSCWSHLLPYLALEQQRVGCCPPPLLHLLSLATTNPS